MKVLLYRGSRLADVCKGPDENGNCPCTEDGGEVACAGMEVALDRSWPLGGWQSREARTAVPRGSSRCPISVPTGFTVVRRREYFSPFATKHHLV